MGRKDVHVGLDSPFQLPPRQRLMSHLGAILCPETTYLSTGVNIQNYYWIFTLLDTKINEA